MSEAERLSKLTDQELIDEAAASAVQLVPAIVDGVLAGLRKGVTTTALPAHIGPTLRETGRTWWRQQYMVHLIGGHFLNLEMLIDPTGALQLNLCTPSSDIVWTATLRAVAE